MSQNISFIVWRLHVSTLYRVIIRSSLEPSRWIIITIKSFYSLWSIGQPWRASRHCSLQLSPWPRSMILSHPLLSFATFSSAYLSFYIPEDSNLMPFSLLFLFLYVMCVQSNSIFFFLSDFLLISDGRFSIVLRSVILSVHFIFIIGLKHLFTNICSQVGECCLHIGIPTCTQHSLTWFQRRSDDDPIIQPLVSSHL